MKKPFSTLYIIVSCLVLAFLHMPYAFAKSALTPANLNFEIIPEVRQPGSVLPFPSPMPSDPAAPSAYDSLDLDDAGLNRDAYDNAIKGYEKLVQQGKLANDAILTIADFSQPSTRKRLYIIDVKQYRMLFNTLVAHGRNTGLETATNFSNTFSSFKSSPGFYITSNTYQGGNGYSLKLVGLEKGINDNAWDRAIVMHGADYVTETFARTHGYLGRSQGCPAVPPHLTRPIINTIKQGTCLFIYHPSYLKRSVLLKD